MVSSFSRLIPLVAALALCAGSASAAAPTAAPAAAAPAARQENPLTIRKVRGDIYEVEGKGGNVVVYATGAGVVLVDNKNNGNDIVDELLKLVRTVTSQPVKYVINTHYHQDHVGNNGRFKELGAVVIGHENAAEHITGPVWNSTTIYDLDGRFVRTEPYSRNTAEGKWKQVGPDLTYSSDLTLTLGGKVVRLRHFGPAHTSGDTFVFFPAEKVLAAGDTLRPFCGVCVDYHAGGSLKGYIRVLDSLLKLPGSQPIGDLDHFDLIVPGHGDLYDRAGFLEHRNKLVKLRDEVVGQRRAGRSYRQVAEYLIATYDWKDGDRNIGQWTFPGIWWEYAWEAGK